MLRFVSLSYLSLCFCKSASVSPSNAVYVTESFSISYLIPYFEFPSDTVLIFPSLYVTSFLKNVVDCLLNLTLLTRSFSSYSTVCFNPVFEYIPLDRL